MRIKKAALSLAVVLATLAVPMSIHHSQASQGSQYADGVSAPPTKG